MNWGALAALGSSATWAFASTRYAAASRAIGSARINLGRSLAVWPVYIAVAVILHRGHPFEGLDGRRALWLVASTVCAYGLGDNIFFAAARRLGISTALAIASTYPLWAALAGVVDGGQPLGAQRIAGTLACVAGVVVLVVLSRRADESHHADVVGLGLALLASLFWAGNSYAIRRGAVGVDVWQVNALRYGVAIVLLVPQTRLGPRGGSVSWLGLLPAILADGIAGSMLYVYGLAHSELAVGATLSSLAPLISVPVAIVLHEERWSGPRFAAVATTVAGAALLATATSAPPAP